MKKMKISIEIMDEDGRTIVNKRSERSVPYIEEIETEGFRAAFGELETAVLEGRKEVSDEAISEYLEYVSKKKRKK
ncbi:MAG: hypothetical protein FWD23_07425 [Oscillospiraceae bacterium]|nr:hypothetical protein [Oscillospiraceae bacterium]